VLTRTYEFHFENRGDEVISREQLQAIGDRNEGQIAADRAADAAYR
jgi:NADH-quinone oxidoreductase subunit I